MRDMKSRTNVDNKLSLILRYFRFAILLESLALTQSSVEPSLEPSSRTVSPFSSLSPLDQVLTPVLRRFGPHIAQIAIPSLRPQFVSQALTLTQSLSLSTLAVSPIPDPISAPLESASNGSVGCAPIARHRMCSCYDLDNGLLIDCNIEAIHEMRDVLTLLISQPIKSFSVHSIDSNNETFNALPERVFSNFSSIEQMYISVPFLVNVSVESLEGLETSLKSLSLVNSKLTAIPVPALKRLKSLSTLDLSSNAVQVVEPYAFYGLPLLSLNLQSNRIHSLLELSFGGLEKTLVELILIGNSLERFPLHALRRLQRLESLKLQSNQISSIADDGVTRFAALKSLDLHSNRIEHLDSHSFITTPKLVSLSVANNKLTVLSDSSAFEGLLDLETLDLSHNQLRVVDINALNALRTVDLSYNLLQDIHFHNLQSLKEVFVSNNNIQKLTNQTFLNSSSLSVIFLQNNAIEAIDYNTFHSLQHLLTLDISSNQLKAIDSQLLRHNTHLQSLYLDNNPFHCDCRLLSIYEWLETHSRLLALNDREDMICAQPERLKHNSILSLHPIDFCPAVPLISLMEISKLESTQVSIRWEVQNDTLVGGFTLEYYLTDNRTPPLTHTQKALGALQRHSLITDLNPENWYTVCVQANGKYLNNEYNNNQNSQPIDTNKNFAHYVTSNRKCSQVRTLSESERSVISLSGVGIILSVVVFVVLMLTLSVLIYFAYKMRTKRRRPLKAEVSEEYITYRHFSLPSSENVYS